MQIERQKAESIIPSFDCDFTGRLEQQPAGETEEEEELAAPPPARGGRRRDAPERNGK